MLESLGSLLDRLVIVNLKIWHLQDWVHRVEGMTPQDFSQRNPQEKIGALARLNKERNALMGEIDRLIPGSAEIVRDKL